MRSRASAGQISILLLAWSVTATPAVDDAALRRARDEQDVALLLQSSASLAARARSRPQDAGAQHQAALAYHFAAEVSLELQEKQRAREAAERGIEFARTAVALEPNRAEHHRLLGALCAQVIPANVLAGLNYGRCALDEVNKAIELDPKSSVNWLSRGVGNLYLPAAFGGGIRIAIQDLQKAVELDPRNADAWAWLGVAWRRLKNYEESQKALQRSIDLNPKRKWTRTQMAKTLLRE